MTSTVLSASLLIHIYLPSGEAWAPCARSIPGISATILLVAASMMCTESPALLVWMIRTRPFDGRRQRQRENNDRQRRESHPKRFDERSHDVQISFNRCVSNRVMLPCRAACRLAVHPGGKRLELRGRLEM